MDSAPLTPAGSTRKTKNRFGFRGHSVANIAAPVFKWQRKWVVPAGMPQGTTYKVLKWVKTAEKARLTSISADINSLDDAEDVDMDGEGGEGEGDEQDDEEMAKPGDESAPVDISMDLDESQQLSRPQSARIEDISSSATAVTKDEPSMNGDSKVATTLEDMSPIQVPGMTTVNAPKSPDNSPPRLEEEDAKTVTESAPVQDGVPPQGPALTDGTPSTTEPSAMPGSPDLGKSATKVTLPNVDDIAPSVLVDAPAAAESASIDVDVEQQLERPEDSTVALALPVPSSIAMPSPPSNPLEILEQSDANPPIEPSSPGMDAQVTDTRATSETSFEPPVPPTSMQNATAISMSLDAETPTPPIQRSRTPSPSPERLEEFRQAEAAAEPTLTVPGNLPSPSPQPDPVSITSPAAVPSNAVEGTVSGSHVASVQLGGGATGTEPGQVTMEATHMQDAGQVTMEGEADPGKSLGEGDPVGVNGEEEFADEDIRRAGSDTPRLSQDGNDLEQSETKEKSEQ